MGKPTERQDAALFQLALVELAGLDPAVVVAGSVAVDIERGAGGTVARFTAQVSVEVDPDDVVRLALKYDRLTAASAATA